MLSTVNVSDWTTAWSESNPSLWPTKPLANGRVAMFNTITNNLIEYEADGTPGQSAAFDWYSSYFGNQSVFGMWTSVDNQGQLASRVSLGLNEARNPYFSQGRFTGQYAPRADRLHTSIDSAAVAFLDFLLPLSQDYGLEMGGFICREGSERYRSSLVQIGEPTRMSVNMQGDCFGAPSVAFVHTHWQNDPAGATPSGFDRPEHYDGCDDNGQNCSNASDMKTADFQKQLVFYMRSTYRGNSFFNVWRYQGLLGTPAKNNAWQYDLSVAGLWRKVNPTW